MKKQVLLLAVSCKNGGLCPGGLDLDDPSKWIRIVRDDGEAGAVQGSEIDFAYPLDVIEFDGRPMPQGKQKENWVIDNNSCKKIGSEDESVLDWVYAKYSYHGFWNNFKAYLTEEELDEITEPSESILKVSEVRIYKISKNSAKIDFKWKGARYKLTKISMTDPDYYHEIDNGQEVRINEAYIVISIPKNAEWGYREVGEKRAYKFVSKIFKIS